MMTLTKALIESASIIDVRTQEEVDEGMFTGAIHICLDDLASEMDTIEALAPPYCFVL